MLREAMLLQRDGRLPEAEAAYERLLARWPDLPDGWYNLAVLQRNARRFDAALASYQHALDRGVARPEEVHLNRGVIYSDCLRRDDAAEAELHAALALNPDYIPALLNLANLKADLGQRHDALALCERILALDPDSSDGLARYADVKSVSDRATRLSAD
jgi:tetratricopeptide (TPR) repeat protein